MLNIGVPPSRYIDLRYDEKLYAFFCGPVGCRGSLCMYIHLVMSWFCFRGRFSFTLSLHLIRLRVVRSDLPLINPLKSCLKKISRKNRVYNF